MGKVKPQKVSGTSAEGSEEVSEDLIAQTTTGGDHVQKDGENPRIEQKKKIKKKMPKLTPLTTEGGTGSPSKVKPKMVKKVKKKVVGMAGTGLQKPGGQKDKTTATAEVNATNKSNHSGNVKPPKKKIKKPKSSGTPTLSSPDKLAKMASQFTDAVNAANLGKAPVQKKRIIQFARPGEKPLPNSSIVVSASAPVALNSRATDDQGETTKKKKTVITIKKVKKKIVPKQEPESSDYTMADLEQSLSLEDVMQEGFSIHHLYQEMRESNVISDRWCIPEPMWDPYTNHEVLLCYEVDVLMDGSVRMKRCIKILDNFELIVLLDGSDKTHLFKEKHPTIRSSQELLDLIRKVTMVKVCSGIIHCDPSDFENMSVKVIARGGSWYSSECNVEVERGCLGNICKKCTSLRNTIRRKLRRQVGVDSMNSSQNPTPSRNLLSNSLKPIVRSLGEALYSNLNNMSGSNRLEEDEMRFLPPPRSSDQVLHPELKIYMNSDLKERLDEVAANPHPPMTETQIVEYDPMTLTKTIRKIHTPIMPTFRTSLPGGRGSKRAKASDSSQNQSFVMGNNGELTLVQSGETIQLPEGFVLADEGGAWGENVVVQKLDPAQESQIVIGEDNSIVVGSNFTLQDGEEYEVIGEAASGEGDSIQVLPLNTNSDIEIIEVDENMIQLVDESSQPEILPIDSNSDIFKFLQAHSRLQV